MEETPAPFGAEQTYITENDIREAQNMRKGSYDEMDQDMPDMPQIDSTQLNEQIMKMKEANDPKKGKDLQSMFENMQISIVGGRSDDGESLVSDD